VKLAKACKKQLQIFSVQRIWGTKLLDELTWLVLGGDPAVRSRRVEQFTAL